MPHAASSHLTGRPAEQGQPADQVDPPGQPRQADTLTAQASALLTAPGLVVLAGGPGIGRSRALRHLGDAFRGPVFTGGGLAMLRDIPAFALARAVRVRLPDADIPLLAEAVRSRVRTGLLILDDLQFADPATLAALPLLATHCRVVAALRTPHRLPAATVAALRAAATGWLTLPPLDAAAATALARATAPGLDPGTVAAVVRRSGGVPLAIRALAGHAHAANTRPDGAGTSARVRTDHADGAGGSGGVRTDHADGAGGSAWVRADHADTDQVAYAVAAALSDLSRPARTAMAALGLLGRPATADLLGAGTTELLAADLITTEPAPPDTPAPPGTPPAEPAPPGTPPPGTGRLAPVSPYVAEIAAGLLDPDSRTALHRTLAALVPPLEAARHLAAAGDPDRAYRTATTAAGRATSTGERADLLLLACHLPGHNPDPAVRVAAATAALATGRPRTAARLLDHGAPADPATAVLRGEALLQAGDLAGARAAVAGLTADPDPATAAGRDRIDLLATLATDPAGAVARAAAVSTRHGDPPAHPGLAAALAAVHAATRAPGWERALATAAATAGSAGDGLAARWSAWLLVETLAADGRLAEAAGIAGQAAQACAADLAYSWQTRFLAAQLWCAALRGRPDPPGTGDDVARRAGDLTDRSLPARARGYATAAVSLVEADGGLLAAARARLAATPPAGPTVTALLDWVDREAAWLDGQPDRARLPDPAPPAPPLVDGLRRITARWAGYDRGARDGTPTDPGTRDTADPTGGALPPPVQQTLTAWTGGHHTPDAFATAATAWRDLAVREEVRCLLACGLHTADPALAVPPLLAAEHLAEQAGLVVLLGRTRRALRRHAVRRDTRGPRTGDDLTTREQAVLRLVARGEPTRRIAGQLGISGETVETHIRAGMRKLGARTRTEAAALALEVLGDS